MLDAAYFEATFLIFIYIILLTPPEASTRAACQKEERQNRFEEARITTALFILFILVDPRRLCRASLT